MVDPGRRPQQLLQRVERARRVVSHCSQAAIRAYEEEALLSEACRHLVDEGDYCMAWFAEARVGEVGEVGGASLTTLAHAVAEPSGVRGDQMPWTSDLSPRMPTMRALLEQRPHVVRGISDDAILKLRFPEAEALGYASICAFPIQFGPHGAGVLSIYAREADAFAPEEVALLRELSGDMAVGVSVLRARKTNDVLEERLELAERRFRSIVEHAPFGVVQVAGDGHLILANQAMANLLGYATPGELAAVGPAVLATHIGPDDLQRLRASVATGSVDEAMRFELRRVDGATTWVEARAKPANGGSQGAIEAFVRDLTAERAAETARVAQERQRLEVVRLEELNRMRSDFMGRASHELNTPLTPILLQVQALQGPGLEPRLARGLSLIERNVVRLAGLVKDLLAASTLEAREVALTPARIDLDEKAAEVVDSFRLQAKEAGIDLRHESTGPVPAFADGGRMVQVLFNLVSNALKFTPRDGSVTVRCQRRPGRPSVCTVSDTGLGFQQQMEAKLFEPFGRLHDHMPDDPGGTGLGLFISKSILDQSGGTLWGRSAGPGKGAAFGFEVPAEEPLSPPGPGRGIVTASGFGDQGADGAPPALPGDPAPAAALPGLLIETPGVVVVEPVAGADAEPQADRTRSR